MSAKPDRRPDRRNGLIRLIHVAARDRHLDDTTYRDLLQRVAGKTSCALMSEAELEKVLKAMRRSGFRVKHARPAPAASRKPHRLRDGQAALITALWIDLWQLGVVRDNSDKAIDAFVARQAGIAHMQWLSPAQANRVIEALKDWCAREGFVVPQVADEGLAAKRALCVAIFRKLRERGACVAAYEDEIACVATMRADDAEQLADAMGFRLRSLAAEERA